MFRKSCKFRRPGKADAPVQNRCRWFRHWRKLELTKAKLSTAHVMQSDVRDPGAISALYEEVTQEFPALNILINNAGIMRKINLQAGAGDLRDITREIETT